jgi:ribosomal-protein-serine acetyltransferase
VFTHTLGESAHLAPIEPWRAAEFLATVERSREHLKPWIPFASRVVDEESARAHLQRFADMQAADTGGFYGIWLDGVLSGGALFKDFNAAMGTVEVGVWLAPEAVGRGLIKAAVSHMIDYAIRVRGLSRVEWFCDPSNERSKAAATRLGMTYEGTMRSSFVANGRRQDSEVWAVLADDWLSHPR